MDNISLHECELVAKCIDCGTLNVIRLADPFEFGHAKDRFLKAMFNDGWDHNYTGNWFCPKCKEHM